MMQKTTNYGLNQWDKSDRIQMEDFNSDNAKVEQALTAQAEAQSQLAAQMAGCGNCKIVYGSYTGTGTYGSSNPNKLTFDHKPILVLVQGATAEDDIDKKLRMMRNIGWAAAVDGNYAFGNIVSWADTGVQWYSTNSSTTQFNIKGTVYYYMALLAADE